MTDNFPHELITKFKQTTNEFDQVKEEFRDLEKRKSRYRTMLADALQVYLTYRLGEEFPDIVFNIGGVLEWLDKGGNVFVTFLRAEEAQNNIWYWYDFTNRVWMEYQNGNNSLPKSNIPDIEIDDLVKVIEGLSEELGIPFVYDDGVSK